MTTVQITISDVLAAKMQATRQKLSASASVG
jgi:hypothetical protein